MTINSEYVGSDFDDFLREEGIFEEVEAAAIRKWWFACLNKQLRPIT